MKNNRETYNLWLNKIATNGNGVETNRERVQQLNKIRHSRRNKEKDKECQNKWRSMVAIDGNGKETNAERLERLRKLKMADPVYIERAKTWNKNKARRYIDTLEPSYVKSSLKLHGLLLIDIPIELINSKRELIKLRRALKNENMQRT